MKQREGRKWIYYLGTLTVIINGTEVVFKCIDPRYLSRTIIESAYMITARGDRQTEPVLVKNVRVVALLSIEAVDIAMGHLVNLYNWL
ncbi:hypothetical protein BZG76_05235 [Salinivibrio sp. AR647]|jgi:hypothetical protein|nr:hypothetical protein BZG76_05235 [Salinivibrio sp. AR647]OOE94923.1 hypothetical protein BZG75_04805 [Salinivibrio sp. AR640]OOE99243.1 hypothetical protein BZG77_04815 [Salinivibrio sp. IB643]